MNEKSITGYLRHSSEVRKIKKRKKHIKVYPRLIRPTTIRDKVRSKVSNVKSGGPKDKPKILIKLQRQFKTLFKVLTKRLKRTSSYSKEFCR